MKANRIQKPIVKAARSEAGSVSGGVYGDYDRQEVRHLLDIEQEKVMGMISIGDLVKSIIGDQNL
ncbi:MAG TPA: hypothetical protein VMT72_24465 [Pseudolabrys sp.]|nr:hypothetical protein [Pseudolabrys sp.]